jgi:hypothetical protein
MGAGTVAEPSRGERPNRRPSPQEEWRQISFDGLSDLVRPPSTFSDQPIPHALRVRPKRAPCPLKPKTPAQSQRQPNLSQLRSLLA